MAALAAAPLEQVTAALSARPPAAALPSRPACRSAERDSGRAAYAAAAARGGQGLQRLPEPSPGDVYLDFEGDPWADDGRGREYLAGLWDRDGTFTAFWAHDAEEEKQLTEDLLDELMRRLGSRPGHARLPLRGLRADRARSG